MRIRPNKPVTIGCDGYKNYGLDGFKAETFRHKNNKWNRKSTLTAFDAKCHQLGANYTRTLKPNETASSWAHFGAAPAKGECMKVTLPDASPHTGYTGCVDPYVYYMGSNLEDDGYRLPFVGTFNITQGPECNDTHNRYGGYPASKEAIDFAMNPGTPVYAARAGEIDAAYDAGKKSFGNLIILKHDNVKQPSNVEWSYYAHLSKFEKTTGHVNQGRTHRVLG